MSYNRRWTDYEDKVIASHVGKSPQSLHDAFLKAALEIDRTPAAVRQRWYCMDTPKARVLFTELTK